MPRCLSFALFVLSLFAASARAQIRNSAFPSQFDSVLVQDGQSEPTLPPVEVRPPDILNDTQSQNMFSGNAGGDIPWSSGAIYSDSQLVGPYNQPVWTTQRPWATTRVYVLPPG